MKNFHANYVYFAQRPSKFVELIFFVSWKYFMFFKERRLLLKENVQLLLKNNVQRIFFVFKQMCGCSGEYFNVF